MNDSILTSEQILEAAESVIRRFGPTKATVVDVATVLGVSHGSVYRHFPSKAALREAVAEQWLARISEPLAAIAQAEGPALDQLRLWIETLSQAKQSRAQDDPELFATYVTLTAEARDVVQAHVQTLVGHIAQILQRGVAHGDFHFDITIPQMARAIFDATARFHNPVHAATWSDPALHEAFEGVWRLILGGLGILSL